VYWIAIICWSGGALGCTGPLDPTGKGRGGIGRLAADAVAGGAFKGAAEALVLALATFAPGTRSSSGGRLSQPQSGARAKRSSTGRGRMAGLYTSLRWGLRPQTPRIES